MELSLNHVRYWRKGEKIKETYLSDGLAVYFGKPVVCIAVFAPSYLLDIQRLQPTAPCQQVALQVGCCLVLKNDAFNIRPLRWFILRFLLHRLSTHRK